jgi:hypothetical protein
MNARNPLQFGVEMWLIVDDQPPPPPPPPPPFLDSVAARTISLSIAGGVAAGVTAVLLDPPTLAANGVAGRHFVWWIVIGLIDGAILGGVGSFIYNLLLSRGITYFKKAFPQAKDVPDNYVLSFWINNRFENFYNWINTRFKDLSKQVDDNFQRKG